MVLCLLGTELEEQLQLATRQRERGSGVAYAAHKVNPLCLRIEMTIDRTERKQKMNEK
jgi:hypothetical protein